MNKKDFKKYYIIKNCIDGIYSVPQASRLLNLSVRQIQRLKKDVLLKGPSGVIHKNRGRKPNNSTSQDTINKIIELKDSYEYEKANFSHFKDLLEELNVNLVPASSSQAKDRIERLWNTLQDRLFTKFRVHKISTIEQLMLSFLNFLNLMLRNLVLSLKKKNLNLLLYLNITVLISKKIGIKVEFQGEKYDVITCDTHNSSRDLNKIFKEKEVNNLIFATYILSLDAKKTSPLLVST